MNRFPDAVQGARSRIRAGILGVCSFSLFGVAPVLGQHAVGWIWFDGNFYRAPELSQVGSEKTDRIVSLLVHLAASNPARSPLIICQITRKVVFASNCDEVGSEACLHQCANGSVIACFKEFEDFVHSLS